MGVKVKKVHTCQALRRDLDWHLRRGNPVRMIADVCDYAYKLQCGWPKRNVHCSDAAMERWERRQIRKAK